MAKTSKTTKTVAIHPTLTTTELLKFVLGIIAHSDNETGRMAEYAHGQEDVEVMVSALDLISRTGDRTNAEFARAALDRIGR